jgi:hypothetical protein
MWLDRWRLAVAQRGEVLAGIRVALACLNIGDVAQAKATLEDMRERLIANADIFPGETAPAVDDGGL